MVQQNTRKHMGEKTNTYAYRVRTTPHPAGSAAPHLRRQAAGGRPHAERLQHPEGVYPSPRAPPAWWQGVRSLRLSSGLAALVCCSTATIVHCICVHAIFCRVVVVRRALFKLRQESLANAGKCQRVSLLTSTYNFVFVLIIAV